MFAEKIKADKILPSRRGYMYFIEHARLDVFGNTLEFISSDQELDRVIAYNIPYANTSFILLGEGTSITRNAARLLASQGVLLGFTGGDGSPLLSAFSEPGVSFLEPVSEYRPTNYMQEFAKIFFDENARLKTAKSLLKRRLELTKELWSKHPGLTGRIPKFDFANVEKHFFEATNTQDLLLAEASYMKNVYQTLAKIFDIPFKRDFGSDTTNKFLDHANYLAYGVAATALHSLGVSFAFPLLHGKTRRGGLVFDVADLIKDGITVPSAMLCATSGKKDKDCREMVMRLIHDFDIFPKIFNSIKLLLENSGV